MAIKADIILFDDETDEIRIKKRITPQVRRGHGVFYSYDDYLIPFDHIRLISNEKPEEPAKDKGILYKLHLIRRMAIDSAERNKEYFNEDNYKWTLGAAVANDLTFQCTGLMRYPTEKMSLFGIPVELDYENVENVQLWRNITSKGW